ncbi:MAG: hypothetical protein H6741_28665 [Alphaproteobacteria bacterium]|nr:hypothetical protein [Alphaproteobacteria bacterium]
MLLLLSLRAALAAPPPVSGPLEPLPTPVEAAAVLDGALVVTGPEGAYRRGEGGWERLPNDPPSGLEPLPPEALPAARLIVADLDADGISEFLLLGDGGWVALAAEPPPGWTAVAEAPPPPEAPATEPPAPPRTLAPPAPEPTWLLGVPMPAFGGSSSFGPPRLVVGAGLTVGSMLPPTQIHNGLSPASIAVLEPAGGRVRPFVGRSTAPLFAWIAGNEGVGLHLRHTELGLTVGSDHLRLGPYAGVGLLGAGVGVRAVLTPWETRGGALRGVEARLAVYAPRTGQIGVYYVHAIPLSMPDRRPRPAPPARDLCERFSLAVGGAAAASSTALAWEYVGQAQEVQWSGSPALAVACELGRRGGGLQLGAETAPLMFYRAPTSDGGGDVQLRHYGSLSAGAFVGGDRARIGPVVSAGVWTVGGGLRAVVTPRSSQDGGWHGVELRGMLMAPSAPSAELMVLYHVWFDPRPGQGRGVRSR